VNNKKVFDKCSLSGCCPCEKKQRKKAEKDKRRVEKKKGNSLYSLHFSTNPAVTFC
jgi:hypothetical protein